MLGHLQVYSSYSFQNSTILIEDLVKKASDLHYEALALTDKDNMYGAMELAKYAKKYHDIYENSELHAITDADHRFTGQYKKSASDLTAQFLKPLF